MSDKIMYDTYKYNDRSINERLSIQLELQITLIIDNVEINNVEIHAT